MASHNFQPHAQPEYTLPGIIHYLQREKTTIDRDRLQWENERGELKARIGKLEGENQSLKSKVEELELELKHSGGDHKSLAKSNSVSKHKFNNVDLNPLTRSKEKLQNQLKEISYLLSHTSIDHTAHLELNKDRAFFSSNSALRQDGDSTVESSLNSQLPTQPPQVNAPNIQIDSPVEQSNKSLSQQDQSPFIQSNHKSVTSPVANETIDNFSDQTSSIESDAETVTDEPEESSYSSVTQYTKHKDWQKFILSTHISTITSISASHKGDILGAAQDGSVKLWKFDTLANGDGEVKPDHTFTGETGPIFDIQWIDDERFVTAAPNAINLRSKDRSVKMKAQASSIDVKNNKLLVVSNKSVSLNNISPNLQYTKDERFNRFEADYARFDQTGDNIIAIRDNSFEMYSLQKGESNTLVWPKLNIKDSDKITDFRIQGDKWVCTINKTHVLVLDSSIKKTIFDKSYGSSVVNVQIDKNHIIVILDHGEIQVYKSGKADQIFKDFNLYGLYEDLSLLKSAQLEVLKGSVTSGLSMSNNYVVAGCDDGMIRGFRFE